MPESSTGLTDSWTGKKEKYIIDFCLPSSHFYNVYDKNQEYILQFELFHTLNSTNNFHLFQYFVEESTLIKVADVEFITYATVNYKNQVSNFGCVPLYAPKSVKKRQEMDKFNYSRI